MRILHATMHTRHAGVLGEFIVVSRTILVRWDTHISSPGERGNGSSLASCPVRGVAVGGDMGGGRRGDSRRACPRPESSES